ncbi:hypothetical protein GRI62_00050 [Erythrobacter arachoides]|uniref:Uncharacterized protein n=1 Tax=Aurantiacibacter arachoides TaxID=1850444 RepID=A0A844ZZ32_9SPHN|nr:hypothetical protein [Aurantiacibacter arachoides]MXO91997.1 hypothetical protein [Aurantiacibacter arachoides]GGD60548.1 hypothetical protein GCM10011411_20950 [Aurantiacibacter arachoides]
MASIPLDRDGRKGGGKTPISAHPAFPAMVALWFAALFGLGSLIVPVQLVETLVGATGIAAIVPAAAPPLGLTARLAIALVATVGGALLGFYAARKVARPRQRSLAIERQDAGFRALNPETDLDDDGIAPHLAAHDDAPPSERTPPPRRRLLALEEDEAVSTFLDKAPLPGADFMQEGDEGDFALDLGEAEEFVEEGGFSQADQPGAIDDRQAFALAPTIDDDAGDPLPGDDEGAEDDDAVISEVDDYHDLATPVAPPAVTRREAEPLSFSPPSLARMTYTRPQAAPAAPPRPFDAPAPGAQPTPPELSSEPQSTEPASEEPVSDNQTFEPFAHGDADFPDATTVDDAAFAGVEEVASEGDDALENVDEGVSGADGETADAAIGLVQLVQRLGDTIEKHRVWVSERAAEQAAADQFAAERALAVQPSQSAAPVPQDFDAAAADEAAQAMAAYFSRPGAAAPATPVLPASPPEAEPRAPGAYAPFAESVHIASAPAGTLGEDDEDEDEDEIADLAASFRLPLGSDVTRATPTPRPSFDIAPLPRAATPVATRPETRPEIRRDASYGSLSAVANPFRRSEEFVRIDEPEPNPGEARPAVEFPAQEARRPAPVASPQAPAAAPRPFDPPAGSTQPAEGQARASNDDNERALREALLNLQRMSK